MIRSTIFKRSTLILNRSLSHVRDGGSSFAAKETAEESRFIHQHEREVLLKLKAELAAREEKVAQKEKELAVREAAISSKPPSGGPEALGISPVDAHAGGSVRAGGGAFGRKEAAIEEKYFRDHDKEKLEQLKHKKH